MNGLSYWSAVLMVAVVVLASCTDDQTECSLEDHIALQTGNFWIYQTMDLDENGDPIEQTARFDTTVVEGTTLRSGKLAYILVTYSGETSDTTYMAFDNGVVYRYNEFGLSGGARWIRLADCNTSHQTQIDEFVDVPTRIFFPTTDEEMILNESRYKVEYSRGSEENVSVAGQTYLSPKFSLQYAYSVVIIDDEDISHPASKNWTETYWFVRDIGIVRYRLQGRNEGGKIRLETVANVVRELTEYFVQ